MEKNSRRERIHRSSKFIYIEIEQTFNKSLDKGESYQGGGGLTSQGNRVV